MGPTRIISETFGMMLETGAVSPEVAYLHPDVFSTVSLEAHAIFQHFINLTHILHSITFVHLNILVVGISDHGDPARLSILQSFSDGRSGRGQDAVLTWSTLYRIVNTEQ